MNKHKIKVLHLKRKLSSDGATMLELNLAQALKNEVCFDWLLYSKGESNWAYKFEELGSKIYECPFGDNSSKLNSIFNKLHTFKKYVLFFKKHPYNIIHIDTDNHDMFKLLFCAFIAGVPHRIIHSHSTQNETVNNSIKSFSAIIKKELIGLFATDFLACSSPAAKWLFPKRYCSKTFILKNGINTEIFSFNNNTRKIYREKLEIHNEYLIGHIGRFSKEKNHDFLIDIFKIVSDLDDSARLLLIGEGELKQKISLKICQLKLEKKIILLGVTDQIASYLCAMDLFVLPSLFEGLGIVNIEAQATGLPCLVSDQVPIDAKINDAFNYMPLAASKELWAEKILSYKQSNSSIKRENAWKKVQSAGFDIKLSANDLLKLYKTC